MSQASHTASTAGRSRLVTPEDVQSLRNIIAPQIEATAKFITDAVPADVRAGWSAFVQGWERACADTPSWSYAPTQLSDAEKQGQLLRMWVSLLAANYVRKPQETSGFQPVNWLPNLIYPSDVVGLKKRLDPFVLGFDQKVATCKEIPNEVRTTWVGVSKAWRDFFDEDVGYLHLGGQMDRAETWERDLMGWQKTFDAYPCGKEKGTAGPPRLGVQVHEPFDDPDAPPPQPSGWASSIQVVAVAGVFIAALGVAARYKKAA